MSGFVSQCQSGRDHTTVADEVPVVSGDKLTIAPRSSCHGQSTRGQPIGDVSALCFCQDGRGCRVKPVPANGHGMHHLGHVEKVMRIPVGTGLVCRNMQQLRYEPPAPFLVTIKCIQHTKGVGSMQYGTGRIQQAHLDTRTSAVDKRLGK